MAQLENFVAKFFFLIFRFLCFKTSQENVSLQNTFFDLIQLSHNIKVAQVVIKIMFHTYY